MAILSRPKINPQQRFDLEDFLALLSAARTDSKLKIKQFHSSKNLILKGFSVTGLGLTQATVQMADSTLILPQTSSDFSWFTAEPGALDEAITDAQLTDNARNYVEILLKTEDNTPLNKAFWDPDANSGEGLEFNQQVDTMTDLVVEFVVSTGGFSGSTDRLPLAIIDTDVNGNIKSIFDRRELFFRLAKPNDLDNEYTWGTKIEPVFSLALTGVTGTFVAGEEITLNTETATAVTGGTTSFTFNEPTGINFAPGDTVTGSTSGATGTIDSFAESFAGADKSISDYEEALKAIFTEIKNFKGTRFWWQDTSKSIQGISDSEHTVIVANSSAVEARWSWSGTELSLTDDNGTPLADDPIARMVTFGAGKVIDLSRQDGQDSSTAISIADGEVLYIDRSGLTDKLIDGVGSGATQFQTVSAGSYIQSDDNYWLAYREGSRLYVRGIGELQSGEDAQISDNINQNILTAIGLASETSLPNYSSTKLVVQNSSLVQAISDLDALVGDLAWKTPVADFASLPTTSNNDGDVRLVLDTRVAYHWDDAQSLWLPLTGGGGLKLIGGGLLSLASGTANIYAVPDANRDVFFRAAGGDQNAGQLFTASADGQLISATMDFAGSGLTASGNIQLGLYSVSGASPNTLLATSTNGLDASALAAFPSSTTGTFTFSGASVVNGTQYILLPIFTGVTHTSGSIGIIYNTADVVTGNRVTTSDGVSFSSSGGDLIGDYLISSGLALSFAADMYLEKAGLEYSDNTIPVSESPLNFGTDQQVAYVVPNLIAQTSTPGPDNIQQLDSSNVVRTIAQNGSIYQTFTPTSDFTDVSTITVNLGRDTGGVFPPANAALEIVQVTGGVPTDTVLHTSTNVIDMANLPSSGSANRIYNFTGVTLTTGTEYAWKLTNPSSNFSVQAYGLNGSNPYANGTAYEKTAGGLTPIYDVSNTPNNGFRLDALTKQCYVQFIPTLDSTDFTFNIDVNKVGTLSTGDLRLQVISDVDTTPGNANETLLFNMSTPLSGIPLGQSTVSFSPSSFTFNAGTTYYLNVLLSATATPSASDYIELEYSDIAADTGSIDVFTSNDSGSTFTPLGSEINSSLTQVVTQTIQNTGIENSDFYFDLQGTGAAVSGGNLSVVIDDLENVPPTASIIARRDGNAVIVGTSSMRLELGESKKLYAGITDQQNDKFRGADYGFFRSDEPVVWTGTELQFTQDVILEMINRAGTNQSYTVALADSPVTLANGENLYLQIDRTADTATLSFTKSSTVPAIPAAGTDIVLFAKRVDVSGVGYLHIPLHKQVIEPGQTVRLGASGAGGAGGNSFLDLLLDRLSDSTFESMTPYIAEENKEDATDVDPSSTGAFSPVDSRYKLENIGDTLVSTQILDATFLADNSSLEKIEVIVSTTDPAPVVEASRNGGDEYQAVTMEQVDDSEIFRGVLDFAQEATQNTITGDGSITGANLEMNDTSAIAYGQPYNIAAKTLARKLFGNVQDIVGSLQGSVLARLVRDDGGSPSLDVNDIVLESAPISLASAVAGEIEFQITPTILDAGDYHIVYVTDSAYKAVYDDGNIEFSLGANDAGTGAQVFDGTSWSTVAGDFALTHRLEGYELDLRVRITSSVADALIEGFGVLYDQEIGEITSASVVEGFHKVSFNAVSDNLNEFTLPFVPNQLLVAHLLGSGQSFRYGDFSLAGNTVVFPEDQFNNGGLEKVQTIIFDNVRGESFDNSDTNQSALAANHLGGGVVDFSQPGRGIILQSPSGTKYEITIKDGGVGFDIFEVT